MAERKRFLLRIDPGLWEEIQRMASREFRSVNAQIEYLLETAVRERVAGASGGSAGGRPVDPESGPPEHG